MGEALFVVMILLQVGDGWATYHGLKAGAVEKNPFVRLLAEKIGRYPALLLVKGMVVYAAYLLISSPYALLGLVIVYGAVVWMNLRIYRNQRKRI